MSFVGNILATASATIDNRAADRDLPEERSMAATVTAFNAIFGTNLTESQGWSFMQLLKIKRSSIGPYKEDDFVDGAAYAALAAEARAAESGEQSIEKNMTVEWSPSDPAITLKQRHEATTEPVIGTAYSQNSYGS